MNIVEQSARLSWKPADMRPPWQWAEEHFNVAVSPFPGKWRSDNSPWVKKPMEDFADNRIRRITVLCSAQSSKTETMLALLGWVISEDPSPTMWVTSTADEALKFWNERMSVSLKNCRPVAVQIPTGRSQAKNMEIHFPTMTLEVVGANSKVRLQSRSRRFLLLDEVRNWPAWALPMVLKRPRAWWNSRVVILTTPDKQNDTVHREFIEGTQNHYHVPCLHCGDFRPLKWENMKWETNDHTKPNGIWNFARMAETLRYVCPVCSGETKDTPANRRRLTDEGKWVSHNLDAPPHLVSYTWSALLPTWVKWASLAEEFIAAQNALEFGNFEPLKTFINESLGEPWEDRLRFAKGEAFIDERAADYDPRAAWAPEAGRFMSIDVQGAGGRHFYWVVRAFAQGGASRLLDFGKAWSIEELRSLIIDWNVPATNVAIDSGHFTDEVYRYIQESGLDSDGNYAWKAMKGDRAPHYLIEKVRQLWTWSFVDPYLGTAQQGRFRPVRQVLYSKSGLLDKQEAFMRGRGPEWLILNEADQLHEFKAQVTAYERFEQKNSKGVVTLDWVQKRADDHWGTCERQVLVSAMAAGMLA